MGKFHSCLTQDHRLDRAKEVRRSSLIQHLLIDHKVKAAYNPELTRAELGRLHLLAHACDAHPELNALLGLRD